MQKKVTITNQLETEVWGREWFWVREMALKVSSLGYGSDNLRSIAENWTLRNFSMKGRQGMGSKGKMTDEHKWSETRREVSRAWGVQSSREFKQDQTWKPYTRLDKANLLMCIGKSIVAMRKEWMELEEMAILTYSLKQLDCEGKKKKI